MTAQEAKDISLSVKPDKKSQTFIDKVNENIKMAATNGNLSIRIRVYECDIPFNAFVSYFTKRGFEVTLDGTYDCGARKYYYLSWQP
jgi:hypothetical protein